MAAKPVILYDGRGNAITGGSSNALFDGAKQTREHKKTPRLDRDLYQNITALGWCDLLSVARYIYGNCSGLKNAINKIAEIAIGNSFLPQYYGENKAFGKLAEALLREWHKICDVRGGPFDFATNLQIWIKALLRDGDIAVLFTETASGYPMIQTIPAHRIGGRLGSQRGIVTGGPYDGYTIINGVIVNVVGCAVALRIVDARGTSFVDVSLVNTLDEDGNIEQTRDAFLLFDPDWADQARGISPLADGVNDWLDIRQVKDFLKQALRKEASFAVVEYTESGNADTGEDFTRTDKSGDDITAAALYTEKTEGGLTKIYKANTGTKVEFPGSERPSDQSQKFWEKITRDAFQAIGWPAEFYDTGGKGGAAIRLIMELAGPTIYRAQYMAQIAAQKVDAWRIAKAIKRGELPFDPEWWKIRHQTPEELTADKGYSAQIDREDYKLGFNSFKRIASRRGMDYTEIADEREAETTDLLERASRITETHNAAHPDQPITIDVALSMLRQTSPNPPQNTALQNQQIQNDQNNSEQ
jgi:hypothetical protein